MMIQNSSKRLAKIKKKLKKNDSTDYHFLINSMQRQSNKQNYITNKQNYTMNINKNKTSLKNSIQLIKPTSMINSFDHYKNSQIDKIQKDNRSKIKLKNTNKTYFFDNVKFLKNSRIEEMQQAQSKISYSKFNRNVGLSQQKLRKIANQGQKYQKSNKFSQILTDSPQQQLQTYIQLVNELFDEILKQKKLQKSNKIQKKKCFINTLGKQLLQQQKKTTQKSKQLYQSVQISNFCPYNSKTINKSIQKSKNLKQKQLPCQNQYKKIIDELSSQNNKLTQLISQHQKQNIKLFVKMNQNQSKQLEGCKKYLSSLYDKYKQLEKQILKQNKKCQQLAEQKILLENKMKQLQKTNSSLALELQKCKQTLNEYANFNQTISKLSFEDQTSIAMFNFNLNQANNRGIRSKSQLNTHTINKNTASLCENSRINGSFMDNRYNVSSSLSHNIHQDPKDQNIKNKTIKQKQVQTMSCSTIAKNKNMKKKKEKQKQNDKTGINLKNQFNCADEENSKFNKQITNLKNKLNQQTVQKLSLKKQIQTLSKKIQALSKSNDSLTKNSQKNSQKLNKMQAIINQQLQQIQKLIQINKKSTIQLKNKQNCIKKIIQMNNFSLKNIPVQQKTNLNNTCNVIEFSQQKIKMKDKKQISRLNINNNGDQQYRIIALQAVCLQNLLRFS